MCRKLMRTIAVDRASQCGGPEYEVNLFVVDSLEIESELYWDISKTVLRRLFWINFKVASPCYATIILRRWGSNGAAWPLGWVLLSELCNCIIIIIITHFFLFLCCIGTFLFNFFVRCKNGISSSSCSVPNETLWIFTDDIHNWRCDKFYSLSSSGVGSFFFFLRTFCKQLNEIWWSILFHRNDYLSPNGSQRERATASLLTYYNDNRPPTKLLYLFI